MDVHVVDTVTLGPVWGSTFPHLIPSLPEEWLPGLLLRCDEANEWIAGTTAGLFTGNPIPNRTAELMVGSRLRLEELAAALALPFACVANTTFTPALTRLFSGSAVRSLNLGQAPHARVCPMCLREGLSLRKHLAWPYITHCPLHGITFRHRCACGAVLLYYPSGSVRRATSWWRATAPFTCYRCDAPWSELPCDAGAPSAVASDERFAAFYRLFLGHPSRALYAKAHYVLRARAQGWQEKDILSGACTPLDRGSDDVSLPMVPIALAPLIRQLVAQHVSPACVEHAHVRRSPLVRRATSYGVSM